MVKSKQIDIFCTVVKELPDKGAKIYRMIINGKEELIRVATGANGFIVTAYPNNH